MNTNTERTLEERRLAINYLTNDCQMSKQHYEPTITRTPISRLCTALISGAIRDLFSTDNEIRSAAEGWLFLDKHADITFRDCCDTIGIDQNLTQDKITSYYEEKEKYLTSQKRYTRRF